MRIIKPGTLKPLALLAGLVGLSLPDGAARAQETAQETAQEMAQETAGTVQNVRAPALWTLPEVNMDAVRAGEAAMPAVLTGQMPAILTRDTETARRKRVFLRIVLPAVLRVNAEIRANRRFVERVAWLRVAGRTLDADAQARLGDLAARYRTAPGDLVTLRRRVDTLPPSLVLAQAAIESGWGRSRFAQQGNALFGQRTYHCQDCGMIPKGYADDPGFRVTRFETVMGSVKAYLRNINTHQAYTDLRRYRQLARRAGAPLDPHRMARFLKAYSERGQDYIADVRAVIDANNLRDFDTARLDWHTQFAGVFR